MTTRAAGSGRVERRTQAFLEGLATGGGKPLEQLSPPDARQVLVHSQSGVPIDRSKAEAADRIISIDRGTVKLAVVRPAGTAGPLSAFMFLHGGGWVIGDFSTHERLVRDLVAGSGAAAVFVDYDRFLRHATRSRSTRPTERPGGSPSTARRSGWTVGASLSSATAPAAIWPRSSA